MAIEDNIFYKLIAQLRSVEIDGEVFFVVEGDLLMTLEELRAVPEKQLRFFVACQKSLEKAQRQQELGSESDSDALENDTDDKHSL